MQNEQLVFRHAKGGKEVKSFGGGMIKIMITSLQVASHVKIGCNVQLMFSTTAAK